MLQIHGTYGFMFTLEEMREFVQYLAGTELMVTASLQHWFGLEPKTGTSYSWIYSSTPHIKFVGGRVRTFKPGHPLNVYVRFLIATPIISVLYYRQKYQWVRRSTGWHRLQIAVHQEDGSAYARGQENLLSRQVRILTTVRDRNGNTETLPEELLIIPDTSIVHYRYLPQENDEMIVVNVRSNVNVCYRKSTDTDAYLYLWQYHNYIPSFRIATSALRV